MSLDVEKHKTQILQVYEDVLDEKTATDWAIFGYEGQTNILKVHSYGEDGLEELVDDLNASKIMYGILRIEDPKTSRTKLILINWQGEGAPHLRKGICARHLPDVKRLFKAAHITVTARTEEDVEQSSVFGAVLKATSTEYNFKDRSEHPNKTAPVKEMAEQFWKGDNVINSVGTNYSRTIPEREISSEQRNKFWAQQEEEEKSRKEAELRMKEEQNKLLEKDRMNREEQAAKHREEVSKARDARILSERKAEAVAEKRFLESREQKGALDYAERDVEEKEKPTRAQNQKGTNYSRTIPEREINSEQRNKFWAQQEEEEKSRKEAELRMKEEQNKLLEKDRMNREEQAAKHREEVSRARDARILSERKAEAVAEKRFLESRGQKGPSDYVERDSEEKERAQRAEMMRAERKKEAESLIGRRTHEARSLFENQIHSNGKESPRSTSESVSSRVSTGISNQSTKRQPQKPLRQQWPPVAPQKEENDNKTSVPGKLSDWNPSIVAESQRSSATEEIPRNHVNVFENQQSTLSHSQNHIEPIHTEDISSSYHGSVSPPTTNGTIQSEPPVNGVGRNETNHTLNGTSEPTPYSSDTPAAVPESSMTYEVDGVEYQILPEHGVCARALYDYQAADETEITFDPGDILTNIDQIDVGWWQGANPRGLYGLFPANYVELINGNVAQ